MTTAISRKNAQGARHGGSGSFTNGNSRTRQTADERVQPPKAAITASTLVTVATFCIA